MSYIICDLDGTLCNVEHRLHFIEQKPPRWKEFFDHVDEDALNQTVNFVLKHFSDTELIFVTGRPESCREKTEVWLHKHNYTSFTLFMRQDTDFRQDAIVKQELYQKKIEPQRGKPMVIFDDRDQVVEMWRSLELPCFQVRKGSY